MLMADPNTMPQVTADKLLYAESDPKDNASVVNPAEGIATNVSIMIKE